MGEAGGRVPEAHGIVHAACGEERAIWRPGDDKDPGSVCFERIERRAGLTVPYARRRVPGAGGEARAGLRSELSCQNGGCVAGDGGGEARDGAHAENGLGRVVQRQEVFGRGEGGLEQAVVDALLDVDDGGLGFRGGAVVGEAVGRSVRDILGGRLEEGCTRVATERGRWGLGGSGA